MKENLIVVGDITYGLVLKQVEELSWLNWRDDFKPVVEEGLGIKYHPTSIGENIHDIRNYFKRKGYFAQLELVDDEVKVFCKGDVPDEIVEVYLVVFGALLMATRFDIYSNLKRDFDLGALDKYLERQSFKDFNREKLDSYSLGVAIHNFNKYFGE